MLILVVLAHPDRNSFNHAIARTVVDTLEQDRHQVIYHDLYAENFDPLLPKAEIPDHALLDETIAAHCRELATAEGIVVIHPNWWGQPPAIMKGWIDRVFRAGVAYEFLEDDSGEGVPNGLLKARKAIVFNTSNTEAGREENTFGDPLDRIWKDCIFGLCGISDVYRKMFRIIITSQEKERLEWLEEVRKTVHRQFS